MQQATEAFQKGDFEGALEHTKAATLTENDRTCARSTRTRAALQRLARFDDAVGLQRGAGARRTTCRPSSTTASPETLRRTRRRSACSTAPLRKRQVLPCVVRQVEVLVVLEKYEDAIEAATAAIALEPEAQRVDRAFAHLKNSSFRMPSPTTSAAVEGQKPSSCMPSLVTGQPNSTRPAKPPRPSRK